MRIALLVRLAPREDAHCQWGEVERTYLALKSSNPTCVPHRCLNAFNVTLIL